MTKYQIYHEQLAARPLEEWDAYLLSESNLPGPRANLELLAVAADLGTEEQFLGWIECSPEQADTNDPRVFLVCCGAVGLGWLVGEGQAQRVLTLRRLANDPRWRVREGAAMGLQRWGLRDMPGLLAEMRAWAQGSRYEQRAAAAGLCEPALLKERENAVQALDVLDEITTSIVRAADRKNEDFAALRKTLGYGWSVAAAAAPEEGKRRLERWMRSPDPDVAWVVRENLKKNRLIKMDAKWVEQHRK